MSLALNFSTMATGLVAKINAVRPPPSSICCVNVKQKSVVVFGGGGIFETAGLTRKSTCKFDVSKFFPNKKLTKYQNGKILDEPRGLSFSQE